MEKIILPEQIYATAILEFGADQQINMAIEECAELTDALCKHRRGRNTDEDVITEIADVMIMAEQMAFLFGPEEVQAEKERKLKRLLERVRNFQKERRNGKGKD